MTIMRKTPTVGRALARVLGPALLLLATGMAPARAADTVYWSIGVSPSPGVSVIAGNAPPVRVVTPVYMAPPPVYRTPPVYLAPAPAVVISSHAYPPVLYGPPRVVHAPAPVYYVQAAPVVVLPQPYWDGRPHRHPGRGWGHSRHGDHGHGSGHSHGRY
jgi:hypothetical protein